MDARTYLDEIVRPTIEEYEAEPTSIRRGLLACIVTCHTLDYMAQPLEPKKLRNSWRKDCAAFKVVDEYAHACKHVSTSGRGAGTHVDDVIERPPARWGAGKWGVSCYGNKVGGVTSRTNIEINLVRSLREAFESLRAKL